MNYENQILDALLIVLACDVPDEDLADAISEQARLMAGIDPYECWEDHSKVH